MHGLMFSLFISLSLVLGGGEIVSGAVPDLTAHYPDPARFETAIQAFEAQDRESFPAEGGIVCIGSSSMRGWHKTIKEDLAPLPVIPRGFGGSTMYDAYHFAPRVLIPYKPKAVLLYEGDNDVAGEVPPETILVAFDAFVARTRESLPEVRIYVLAVKPSIARWKLWPEMQRTNMLLSGRCDEDPILTFIDIATPMLGEDGTPKKDIFTKDNLHMNPKGYAIWTEVVRPILMKAKG